MQNAAEVSRQPLRSLPARQVPGGVLPPFKLLTSPSSDDTTAQLNAAAILAHASRYNEPVDEGLALLLAGDQVSAQSQSTAAPAPLRARNSSVAACAVISSAMRSSQDLSGDESLESFRGLAGHKNTETAAQRKERLITVATQCSLDNPPRDEDLALMQTKPLKLVLEKLGIKSEFFS